MQDTTHHTPMEKTLETIKRGISYLASTIHDTNAQKLSDDPMLPEKTVAAILGVSCSLLQHHRLEGKGITFVKVGRNVRYKKSDVDAYITANTRRSTSDVNGGGNGKA